MYYSPSLAQSVLFLQTHPIPTVSMPNQDTEDGTKGTCVPPSRSSSIKVYNWKERRTRDVIDSLKKRIQPGSNATLKSQSSTVSNCSSLTFERETSLDEKLAAIMPQFDSLSPEAKKSLSLQRDLPVKILLPFDTIATMCPSLTLGSTSAYGTNTTMPTQSPLTQFLSTRRSERGLSFSPAQRSRDSAAESDEVDGLYYATPDAIKPETPVRPPYIKSVSSPPAIVFDTGSNRTSSLASESECSLETSDRTSSETDEKMWKNPESEQQPTANKVREHKKLLKRGPGRAPVKINKHQELSKRESYKNREGNSAFYVLGECGNSSFSFDEAVINSRFDSICNESEESLREVRAALQSPSLRSPFRNRARRLSPDERPRSKSADS